MHHIARCHRHVLAVTDNVAHAEMMSAAMGLCRTCAEAAEGAAGNRRHVFVPQVITCDVGLLKVRGREITHASRIPATENKPLRILVVGETTGLIQTLCPLLELQGHHAEGATLEDGLEYALTFLPNAVVVEVGRRTSKELLLASALRATTSRNARLIALSAHDHEQKVLAAGYDAFLMLPASLNALARLMQPTAGLMR